MTEKPSTEVTINRKKSLRVLLFMALLFGLPYAGAFYMFFSEDGAAKMDTSNNGLLVSPVRKMQPQRFRDLIKQQDFSYDFSQNWTMLTFASSDCDTRCTDNLYAMKQVRLALGVERSNVRRMMLLQEQQHLDELKSRLGDFAGMDVVSMTAEGLEALQETLQYEDQSFENAIFLFDPYGNYMMYYPPSTHPKLLLADMQLLIKVSNH